MTKKILITLFILALFASCGTRGGNNAEQQTDIYEEEIFFDEKEICETATFDEGVVINGVRWATRNVDMPGTFAETPECFGMLFQWNRKRTWNTVDEKVEGWNNSIPEGTAWYAENDPCPEGWRVPTEKELRLLNEVNSEWITQNGVDGRIFGTAPNQIFLPAAGWRFCYDGTLVNVGERGLYWGSTQGTIAERSVFLWFHSCVVYVLWYWSDRGHSVRCVSIN